MVLPKQFSNNLQSQSLVGNQMPSEIQTANGSNTKLIGKLAGMILQFGQPNLHMHLQLCKNDRKILQVFNAYNKEFDDLVHQFPTAALGDEDILAIGKLCKLFNACHAFIHCLLGWKS